MTSLLNYKKANDHSVCHIPRITKSLVSCRPVAAVFGSYTAYLYSGHIVIIIVLTIATCKSVVCSFTSCIYYSIKECCFFSLCVGYCACWSLTVLFAWVIGGGKRFISMFSDVMIFLHMYSGFYYVLVYKVYDCVALSTVTFPCSSKSAKFQEHEIRSRTLNVKNRKKIFLIRLAFSIFSIQRGHTNKLI